MRKLLVGTILLVVFQAASPAYGAVPWQAYMVDNPAQEARGAKRLTPVLELLGDELERVGIKLFDNAVYSIDRLWKDTVTLNINRKRKI